MSLENRPVSNNPEVDALVGEIIRRGDAYFAAGNFQAAALHFAAAMKQRPGVAEHAYRAGLALSRQGNLDSAKEHFERAIQLNPDFAHSHGELGRVLLTLGQIEAASKHARRAVELEPNDATLAIALASVLEADRQPEPAGAILDRLIAQRIQSTDLAMVYARMAPRRGLQSQALSLIDSLLSAKAALTAREQSALHFAAANLLDSAGRYDEAFAHASSANSLRGASYDAGQTAQSFQNFIDYFTKSRLDSFPCPSTRSDLPIFIVGMPRSGTSLVEQILSSHPEIHGAGELDWIARTFGSAVHIGAKGKQETIESLNGLSVGDVDALAAEYLRELRGLNPSARHITDKMPTNFIYLGLIAMLFPGARLIHCRRDPLDTCLSCFMTDFAAGYEFSFSLQSLAHFYREYERMMAHWKSVIDLPMLEVDYETVVESLESESRRMVEFVGLPWDEQCLRFYDNKRFAGTASHAQVRKPVYQSSVDRWRNYEKFSTPLKEALGIANPPAATRSSGA